MAARITKLADRLSGFVKSRIGLAMMLALQIFVVKAMRTKPLYIAGTALLLVYSILGFHLGTCPVGYAIGCICTK